MPADSPTYLEPPREAPAGPVLGWLTGPLWLAIVLLVLAAVAAAGLLADRQDPTLSVPGGSPVPSASASAGETAPVAPDLPEFPAAEPS